mmetsp:Transcript_12804/g.27012  ORF Transcript_12804/g.27012 Transcript_12804/m.27012 type:complete len:199 (-) Transcript_12804:27-623(-)
MDGVSTCARGGGAGATTRGFLDSPQQRHQHLHLRSRRSRRSRRVASTSSAERRRQTDVDGGDGVGDGAGLAGRRSVSLGLLVCGVLGLEEGPCAAEEGKYERTKLGVPFEDVYLGPNPKEERAVKEGDVVEIDYVLRRSNGYFIYGTIQGVSFQPSDVPTEPFLFKVGSETVIPGLSDVVRGMRKGGKRRALIPPRLG